MPHVDGQEVEEIFLDIEREMSNRALNFLDSQMENNVASSQEPFNQQSANPASSHGVGFPSGHPVNAYGQAAVNHSYNAGAAHFQSVSGGSGYQQGPQNHMDGFSNSVVPGPLGFNQNSVFPRGSEFDLDDLPKGRRRPPSPRVDPLKQQQKWEEDEKLGAMATISPVLYANLEHVNLKQEYPGKGMFAKEIKSKLIMLFFGVPNLHLRYGGFSNIMKPSRCNYATFFPQSKTYNCCSFSTRTLHCAFCICCLFHQGQCNSSNIFISI